MQFSRQDVFTWAPSDVLSEGSKLFTSGAVQGMQTREDILAGSLKFGASRIVVQLLWRPGMARPKVKCPCMEGQQGRVCKHVIAVALQWVHTHGTEPAEETLVFAAERAPTREEILRWVGPNVLARAEDLIRRGLVSHIGFQYPVGKGYVESGGVPILATFKMLPNGLVEGQCPCYLSRDRGVLCEHIAAVALGVMHHYGNEERRKLYAQERARAARLAQAEGLIQRGAHGTPALIRVFLPSDIVGQFNRGSLNVALRIYVGKQAYKPQDLPKGVYTFSQGDENLLGVLEDIVGGAFRDTLTLEKPDFLSILRCGTQSWVGSGSTKQRLLVHADKPLETPLRLTACPEEDALHLSLRKPEEGTLLVDGRVGFWLGKAEARPLKAVLPAPFHSLYRQTESIPRAQIAGFFKAELATLTACLPLDEESVTPDLFTVTPGTPQFVLELQGSQASVAARLRAVYGSQWVTVGVPGEVSQPDPDDFYHCYGRDLDAEKSAKMRALDMGFTGGRGEVLGEVVGIATVLRLLGEHVTSARREGWKVRLSGPISEFFDAAEVIVPVVHVHDRGEGKEFEVTTSYEAPQGKIKVTAAEIERALAHNHAYIEKDGKTALLDIGAIRTLRETLQSCRAVAGSRAGSSRIDAVHAPFVQAALARLEGIDFEATPDWVARAHRHNRAHALEPVPLGPLEDTLRPYQKEGVYWLRFLESCGFCGILADEMGLGKTLQTLTWLSLERCNEKSRGLPALIICPTSLVENWRREALKFVPWKKCLVVSGPDRAPLFAQVPDHHLIITSYALLRRDIEFYTQCRFSAIVLDEAQAIKNQRTQNALAVKELNAETRLVLTGTPIENGVSDLWSIMDFLMPKYLGPYEDFKCAYEDRIELGGQDAVNAQLRLREKLHPFLLRRVKKDVAKDLPDKIRTVSYCTLTPEQRKAYEEIRTQVREKMKNLVQEKGFAKSKFEMLALLMKLRQICCDLRLLKDYKRPIEMPGAKIEAFMELLKEAIQGGHRILLFSQFTTMLKLIAQELEEEGHTYCYLDGATKDRLEQCAKFNQTPSIPVFLISLKAGGTGLNLTGADMVVHFDPWWNPAAEEQATDRAHRIGQKKTVQAIKLIAQDTIEEKVLALQRKKQTLIDATVNTTDNAFLNSLTLQDIQNLLA